MLDGLADGTVDVVIGTHRLLQTGVRWKDLGLVVVDEEQRFGVEHKEHIKSAAHPRRRADDERHPDPAHAGDGLTGIREMSTILTPPEERHPVLTYVGPYDDKQIAAAIRRELLRDGQVVLRPQPGRAPSTRPPPGCGAGAGGAGRRRARPDARGPAGAHGRGLLEPRVRRPGLHHDRRDRAGHLQREHADRRARRHVRAVPAAPAARPGRPRPRARLRLLPLPAASSR